MIFIYCTGSPSFLSSKKREAKCQPHNNPARWFAGGDPVSSGAESGHPLPSSCHAQGLSSANVSLPGPHPSRGWGSSRAPLQPLPSWPLHRTEGLHLPRGWGWSSRTPPLGPGAEGELWVQPRWWRCFLGRQEEVPTVPRGNGGGEPRSGREFLPGPGLVQGHLKSKPPWGPLAARCL